MTQEFNGGQVGIRLGKLDGFTLYDVVDNSPVNRRDEDGHSITTILTIAVFAAVVGSCSIFAKRLISANSDDSQRQRDFDGASDSNYDGEVGEKKPQNELR